MHIERSDGRVTLYFEISPNQQAMTVLFGLAMAGFAIGLLYGCIHTILYAPARIGQVVPLFLGCSALAAWNGTRSSIRIVPPSLTSRPAR
jgi:hypothetical protein